MTPITYSETTTDKGIVIVIRDNNDGTTSSFQADEANSDYQAYLDRNKQQAALSTPIVSSDE